MAMYFFLKTRSSYFTQARITKDPHSLILLIGVGTLTCFIFDLGWFAPPYAPGGSPC